MSTETEKLRGGQTHPTIRSVATALPGEAHPQPEIQQGVSEVWSDRGLEFDDDLLGYFFENVGVDARHLALPLEEYPVHDGFTQTNEAFVRCATDLGAESLERALERAGVAADQVDAVMFTTVTGVASPSIDAHLMNRLDLPRDCRRFPLFGLGCVGGAATLGRAVDYLRGHPEQTVAVVAVELCSLTLERDELSTADYIAAALFGDGAASVVLQGAEVGGAPGGGSERSGVPVHGSESVFYRDHEWVMGWEIGARGFDLVLSGDLPEVIETQLGEDVASFLADYGLEVGSVDTWLTHPGGPRVIEAFEEALGLDSTKTDVSRKSLRSVGNLSSASVLHVLESAWGDGEAIGDRPAVLSAMGPGFCAEFVLLGW